jgi:hypothetical protein
VIAPSHSAGNTTPVATAETTKEPNPMTNTASPPPADSEALATETVTRWINEYLRAWETNDREDIAALFAEDAQYHERPFDTEWIGREAIIDGRRGRWDWQQGGWTFQWTIARVEDLTAVITGVGHYAELGSFDNVWTVTFDEHGRCRTFQMVNTERLDSGSTDGTR